VLEMKLDINISIAVGKFSNIEYEHVFSIEEIISILKEINPFKIKIE
jgi:hypothetical protein